MATFNGRNWTVADMVPFKYVENWDAFFDDVIAEMDARRNDLGVSLVATSSTNSVSIGTGTKTLTVASPSTKGFAAGMYVMAVDGSNSANSITGRVTSYDTTTGALVISVPTGGTTGSGTPSSWVIGISGAVGPQGPAFAGGDLTGAINEAAVTLASAATTDLGAAAGNAVRITGATTVTALGTAQSGARRHVTFSGTLTLTHNATSLILPGAANITTTAGDTAEFESLGSGNWRCMEYNRASGLPILTSGGNTAGRITATVMTMTAASNTFTPNCALGNEFDCGTIAAASTIANPINPPASGTVQPLCIKWTQDATGGRTMSLGANCINIGGTSANTSAGKTNFAVGKVYSDGKFYYSLVKGA